MKTSKLMAALAAGMVLSVGAMADDKEFTGEGAGDRASASSSGFVIPPTISSEPMTDDHFDLPAERGPPLQSSTALMTAATIFLVTSTFVTEYTKKESEHTPGNTVPCHTCSPAGHR
jgi:hypothetical protein